MTPDMHPDMPPDALHQPDEAHRARQAFLDTLAREGYPAEQLPAVAAMLEELHVLSERHRRGQLAGDDARRLAALQRRVQDVLAPFEHPMARRTPTLKVRR